MTLEQFPGLLNREALVDRYLFGACMVMAASLARLHDAPTVGIYDDIWVTVPRHVGISTGPDSFGDARGLYLDRSDFLAGYESAGTRITPISLEDMRRIWGRRIVSWDVPSTEMETMGFVQRSLAA